MAGYVYPAIFLGILEVVLFKNFEVVISIKNLSDKNKTIIFLIFLIAFFAVLIVWYFNKGDNNEKLVISKSVKDVMTVNEINIGLYSEDKIENINPIDINNEAVRYISDLVYNQFFEFNDNYKLESNLIESYSQISDKSYVFKLKDNIVFSNGKVLTSKDIKNTIEKIFANYDSYYTECLDNIQNVKVIDNSTLRINLINKDENFLEDLLFPILSDELNVGTNKYKIVEMLDNKIVLNNIETGQVLNIYVYNDLEQLYGDFKSKKLDLIKSVENIEYQKYIGEFGYQEKNYKGNKYICIDFDNKVLRDKMLQEAILSAINCDEIVRKSLNKNSYDVKNVKYNLDRVIEILESKGFVYNGDAWYNNGEILDFNILINGDRFDKLEVVNVIEEQLEKVGIRIQIINVGEDEFNAKVRKYDYDILITEKSIDSPNIKVPDDAIICNKLTLLYSLNLSGEIAPNSYSIFKEIETWKKIIDSKKY